MRKSAQPLWRSDLPESVARRFHHQRHAGMRRGTTDSHCANVPGWVTFNFHATESPHYPRNRYSVPALGLNLDLITI